MTLPILSILVLAQQCAPSVAPETLLSIAAVESGFDANAIGVNRPFRRSLRPNTRAEAIRAARQLIASGADVDLGLLQINHRQAGRLGLSLEEAFDPCRSLAAGAEILAEDFTRASTRNADAQAALRTAISRYNTGSDTRGFTSGYVAKVVRAAGQVVPALRLDQPISTAAAPPADAAPDAPSWDVFASPASVLVFPAGDRPSPHRAIPRGARHEP